jgi:hypothetical protein
MAPGAVNARSPAAAGGRGPNPVASAPWAASLDSPEFSRYRRRWIFKYSSGFEAEIWRL